MFKDLMSKCSRYEMSQVLLSRHCELNAVTMTLQPLTLPQSSPPVCALRSRVFAAGMQSSSMKLFPSVDQKPMLLKRQAFAMFSGEIDQYHLYLPLIQGTRPR